MRKLHTISSFPDCFRMTIPDKPKSKNQKYIKTE